MPRVVEPPVHRMAARLHRCSHLRLMLPMLAVVTGCEFGEVEVLQPPPVERGELTLQVVPSGAHEAFGRLGWSEAVPGVEVRVVNADTTLELSGMTDATGRVRFDLPAGTYAVAARREFSDAEWEQVSDLDVTLLAASGSVHVDGSAAEQPFEIEPSLRGGVLISEWSFYLATVPGFGGSQTAGFYELYNNGDTTAYLDGMLIGTGPNEPRSLPHDPCTYEIELYYDRDNFWTDLYGAFPGTGREYPLQPGEMVIVAVDAVDFHALSDSLSDLSRAEFEFIGGADVDNPHSANMINLGRRAPGGHGFSGFRGLSFLASPRTADPATVTMPWGITYHSVPASTVLDVFAHTNAVHRRLTDICSRQPHPLDGAPMEQGDYNNASLSGHRRVARVLPDGRLILQNTRNSAVDFYPAPHSPWRITR